MPLVLPTIPLVTVRGLPATTGSVPAIVTLLPLPPLVSIAPTWTPPCPISRTAPPALPVIFAAEAFMLPRATTPGFSVPACATTTMLPALEPASVELVVIVDLGKRTDPPPDEGAPIVYVVRLSGSAVCPEVAGVKSNPAIIVRFPPGPFAFERLMSGPVVTLDPSDARTLPAARIARTAPTNVRFPGKRTSPEEFAMVPAPLTPLISLTGVPRTVPVPCRMRLLVTRFNGEGPESTVTPGEIIIACPGLGAWRLVT